MVVSSPPVYLGTRQKHTPDSALRDISGCVGTITRDSAPPLIGVPHAFLRAPFPASCELLTRNRRRRCSASLRLHRASGPERPFADSEPPEARAPDPAGTSRDGPLRSCPNRAQLPKLPAPTTQRALTQPNRSISAADGERISQPRKSGREQISRLGASRAATDTLRSCRTVPPRLIEPICWARSPRAPDALSSAPADLATPETAN
jgi:hypothetical protein